MRDLICIFYNTTITKKGEFMKTKILSVLAGLGFIGMANAADMTIYYSPTCPHCHHAQEFTRNNFIYEYPTMNVTLIDVTVPEHRALFLDALKACEFSSGGVPVIKIGDKCFQGFAESMADELRAAIEVDMPDDAKKAAADVKKAIADDGEKYRSEHSSPVASVSEYTAEVTTFDEAEKKTNASDNRIASWTLIVLAFIVLGFSVVAARRKKSKK